MTQRYVLVLTLLLTLVGLSVFVYKWQVLGFPLAQNQEASVWTIESAISFDSGPGSIKVNLHIPSLTPGFRTLNENSVSRGYGFSLNYGSGGREAQWAIRRADGRQLIVVNAASVWGGIQAAGRRAVAVQVRRWLLTRCRFWDVEVVRPDVWRGPVGGGGEGGGEGGGMGEMFDYLGDMLLQEKEWNLRDAQKAGVTVGDPKKPVDWKTKNEKIAAKKTVIPTSMKDRAKD